MELNLSPQDIQLKNTIIENDTRRRGQVEELGLSDHTPHRQRVKWDFLTSDNGPWRIELPTHEAKYVPHCEVRVSLEVEQMQVETSSQTIPSPSLVLPSKMHSQVVVYISPLALKNGTWRLLFHDHWVSQSIFSKSQWKEGTWRSSKISTLTTVPNPSRKDFRSAIIQWEGMFSIMIPRYVLVRHSSSKSDFVFVLSIEESWSETGSWLIWSN